MRKFIRTTFPATEIWEKKSSANPDDLIIQKKEVDKEKEEREVMKTDLTWFKRRLLQVELNRLNWPYMAMRPRPGNFGPGTAWLWSCLCQPSPTAVSYLGCYLGTLGRYGPARSVGLRNGLILTICKTYHKDWRQNRLTIWHGPKSRDVKIDLI